MTLASYPAYLDALEAHRLGVDVPCWWVPTTSLVADVGGEIVGRTSIRHELVFIEGHSHEAFLDDENRAMKDRFLLDISRRFDQIGLRASPELAVSVITGTIVQLIRNGAKADPDDIGERLWAALRAEPR